MKRFNGRTVFLTGGAHGIGAATARRLREEGATLVVADKDLEAADKIAVELGEGNLAVHCDITDSASVDAAVSDAVARFGPLHALINVAGGSRAHPPLLDGMVDADWTDLVDLNLTGAMRCIRAVAPHLSRGGAIVLVSSVNGLAAFGDEAYSSAKAGLSVLAKNLAVRLGPAGIRINVVAPGTIRTRVWDGPRRRRPARRALSVGPRRRADRGRSSYRVSRLRRRLVDYGKHPPSRWRRHGRTARHYGSTVGNLTSQGSGPTWRSSPANTPSWLALAASTPVPLPHRLPGTGCRSCCCVTGSSRAAGRRGPVRRMIGCVGRRGRRWSWPAWHHHARYVAGTELRRRWDLAPAAARARGDAGNRRLHQRWVRVPGSPKTAQRGHRGHRPGTGRLVLVAGRAGLTRQGSFPDRAWR